MTAGMMPWTGKQRTSTRRTNWQDSPEYQADQQRREQLVATARATDLVQLAGRYSQLRRKAPKEYEGPCPKCGGVDRFVVDERGWFCRTCKSYDEAHGWYGAIDFVMWITGLDFMGAVGWLTGAQMTAAVQQRAPVAAQPERTEPTDEWRAEAEGIVNAARVNLFNVNLGGADYLDKRGLEPSTWQAFGWGWAEYRGRAAIVMPWYRGGRIMAIRYRYIEPAPDGQRLIAQPGSKFAGVLYGGQAMEPGAEQLRTLVLCEGEINAASIWQVAHDTRLDVLSVGSESTRLTDPMLAHAAKYKQVIVWMDRREIADKMRQQLTDGGSAGTVAVSSPLRKDDQGNVLTGADGKPQKWDANDLLRIGKLGAFLAGVRVKACGNDAKAREGLLWDLADAARLPLGIDPGTGAAALRLAGELGKKVTLYECPDWAWRAGQ